MCMLPPPTAVSEKLGLVVIRCANVMLQNLMSTSSQFQATAHREIGYEIGCCNLYFYHCTSKVHIGQPLHRSKISDKLVVGTFKWVPNYENL